MKNINTNFLSPTKTKFFVVSFESDQSTVWRETDERVTELLRILANSLAQSLTTGSEPAVVVHKPSYHPFTGN